MDIPEAQASMKLNYPEPLQLTYFPRQPASRSFNSADSVNVSDQENATSNPTPILLKNPLMSINYSVQPQACLATQPIERDSNIFTAQSMNITYQRPATKGLSTNTMSLTDAFNQSIFPNSLNGERPIVQ